MKTIVGVTPSLAKRCVALILSPVVDRKLTPFVPTNSRASEKLWLVRNLEPDPPFGWPIYLATTGRNLSQAFQFDFSTILIPAGVPSAKNNVILKARPLDIMCSEDFTTWRYSTGESVEPGITTVIAQLTPMKFRDITKLVEADGWRITKQKGSHRQYKHPSRMGKVTIAGHPSAEVAPKTLRSILEQAGLKR